MWNQSLFFISNWFQGTQNNVGPLNERMTKEFSWVVTMATDHAQHCHLTETCPVTVATAKTIVIAGYLPHHITQNQFSKLCNINAWWKRHRSQTVARFGCKSACRVTYLLTLPQGRPRYEISNHSNSREPIEYKIVITKIITYKTSQSNLPNVMQDILTTCISRYSLIIRGLPTTRTSIMSTESRFVVSQVGTCHRPWTKLP